MKRVLRWFVPALLLAALTACSPPRESVFPPAARIQELHIQPDGHWQLTLRIQNNSYTSMRFTTVNLRMMLNKQDAGTLTASPNLDIPQFAADVVDLQLTPSPAAAAALSAIANKGSSVSISYILKGSITATTEHDKKPRDFDIDRHDWLSPVPGIDNTFR